jgi:hypothetical protein
VAVSSHPQLLAISFQRDIIGKTKENTTHQDSCAVNIEIEELSPGAYHAGNILSVDSPLQRPVVISLGADQTIRVWNYLKLKNELVHKFRDEPVCVSSHFNGLQCLIAFKDRIRSNHLFLCTHKALLTLCTVF